MHSVYHLLMSIALVDNILTKANFVSGNVRKKSGFRFDHFRR